MAAKRLLSAASVIAGGIAVVHGVARTPAAGLRAPRCLAVQLRLAQLGQVSEKTEQSSRLLRLRNVSTKRCDLHGYPSTALLDGRGRVLRFSYRPHGDQMLTNAAPLAVPLGPGASAYFGINKTPCVRFSDQIAAGIRVTPPGDATAISSAISRYPLLLYCRPPDAGSVIDITPIEPRASAVFAPG